MAQPYQWNPEDYARNSAAQAGWALALLDELRLTPGERVLDLGCGDGKVTAEMAARAAPGLVVGADRSFAMLRLARGRYGPAHPNLHFCQQDAARLGFAGGFDAVFSNAALHWVPDHPAVLRGVWAALRPGGRLLFSMGGRGNAAGIIAVLDAVIAAPPWREHFAGFPFPYTFAAPGDYRRWLPQAGLRLERAELVEKDMVHAGRAGLAGWIRTTWLPYLSRLPEERREPLIDAVVERYLREHPLDEDGSSHVRMVRLEVAAARP